MVIDVGPRYNVEIVTFQKLVGVWAVCGPLGISEADLRAKMKLLEGRPYDQDTLQRDVREIVRAYSASYGYIYLPGSADPNYLRVEPKPVFRREAGRVA